MKPSNYAIRCALAAALITLAAGGYAWASGSWDGGGADNNWSTLNNWSDNLKPANDGTITIHMAGLVRPAPNVDVAWNIAGLIFDAGAAPFTLTGATLTINGDVRNLDTDLQTVNNSITMGAPLHFDAYTGN
ncbi:MAG: hypothetical protein NT049_13080, partial [Planctomycetota bacterium]|nr:hypothetical protein [Planctomycetota bacterium]